MNTINKKIRIFFANRYSQRLVRTCQKLAKKNQYHEIRKLISQYKFTDNHMYSDSDLNRKLFDMDRIISRIQFYQKIGNTPTATFHEHKLNCFITGDLTQ